MFELDLRSKKSIHEQIVDGIKNMIISGEIKTDDKLPSVRDLSSVLTVNPNTIAKAFRSLESQGWIYTVSGRGAFVSEGKHAPDFAQTMKIYNNILSQIQELRFMGIGENEIITKISEMLEKGGAQNDWSYRA